MGDWQEVRPRVRARARQLDEDEIFVGTSGRVDAPAGSWILEQVIGDTRYSYVLLDDDFHRQWLGEGEDFEDDEETDGSPIQIPPSVDALATVGTPVETDPTNANVRPADFDFAAQETDRSQTPAQEETDNALAAEREETATDTTTRTTGATDSDENASSEMPPAGNTLEDKGPARRR